MDFQPIILGTEAGVYGSARAFHEAYGLTSKAWGRLALTATKGSRIVEVTAQDGFTDPKTFRTTMLERGRALKGAKPDLPLVVVPGGDDYSLMLSRYRDELADLYELNFVDYDLHRRLANKASFYALCDEHDLPHPATFVLDAEGARTEAHHRLPFGFPVALKPADSVAWNKIDFEGRKKAYRLQSQPELDDVVAKIYGAGYEGKIIIQDFIPGGDEQMRVLNCYVGSDHKVRGMVLGRIVLADPTPYAIGNYAAIVPYSNDPLCEKIAAFLEAVGYQGFANFDIKQDPRDGKDKLFEINLRPGRTAYFASANGLNVGRCYAEDLVYHNPADGNKILHGDTMLLEVPPTTLKGYATPGEGLDQALALLDQGKWTWTLRYRGDLSLARRLVLRRLAALQRSNFDAYGTKPGAQA